MSGETPAEPAPSEPARLPPSRAPSAQLPYVAPSAIPSPKPLGLFFALAATLSGAFGTVFWLRHDGGPPAEVFPEAAAVIRKGYQPGDLILMTPFYATRAREQLGDLNPVAPRNPVAEDFRAYRRVWVFGLFGEGRKLRPGFLGAGLSLEEEAEPVPGITVDRYRVSLPWEVRYDFAQHLKEASVTHEYPDGKREPCATWTDKNGQGGPFGRWACPHDAEWFYVAPEWHYMGDHQRLCVWAHPPSQGRLVVRFPNVPMTGHLYGHAGHTLNSSIYARERIDFDVRVGEAVDQRFEVRLEETWRTIALRTPETGTATVSFAVSTPDAGANHFCFALDMRAPPP
ncbi:MAG: hypothetical protein U1E65_22415 [Myxococcota bacterium]